MMKLSIVWAAIIALVIAALPFEARAGGGGGGDGSLDDPVTIGGSGPNIPKQIAPPDPFFQKYKEELSDPWLWYDMIEYWDKPTEYFAEQMKEQIAHNPTLKRK